MICKNPYVLTYKGIRPSDLSSYAARIATTPFGCGQCMPCRILRARIWQHRILLEAKDYDCSTFYSPTYSDEYLSLTDEGLPTVDPHDHTLFMKKLRKKLNRKIRYFAVGEYGDKNWRPHMHYVLFGVHPAEKPLLDSCWTYERRQMGYSTVGEINKRRAGYISGYITKKLTSRKNESLQGRRPEFARMSLKPAIGSMYIQRLAEKLRKVHPNVDWQRITYLKYGKKTMPIGQYLTKKLGLWLHEDQPDLYQKYCQREFVKETIDYLINSERLMPYNSGFYQRVVEVCGEKADKVEFKHKVLNCNREFRKVQNEKI